MKILHVISSLSAGGAETLVKDICIRMAGDGFDMGIAYISSASSLSTSESVEQRFREAASRHSVKLYEIGHSSRRNPLFGASQLRAILSDFQPDVLHCHLATSIVHRLLIRTTIPTVYTQHNIVLEFPTPAFLLFDMVVDQYVGICETCHQMLRSHVRREVVLIRNGSSFTKVKNRLPRLAIQPPMVLSVGSIRDQKDYDTLIEVAGQVVRQWRAGAPAPRFLVAGDGARINEMRSKVTAAGLDGVVEFLGARKDVRDLMLNADMLLMTSRYEGLPITMIEALHCGLPIVATAVGGCVEIVEDGKNGYLEAAGDAPALAARVIEVLSDGELAKEMSERSLERADDYSIEQCAAAHEQLYLQVTGRVSL